MFKIITIPFDRNTKSFDEDLLNRLVVNKQVKAYRAELFYEDDPSLICARPGETSFLCRHLQIAIQHGDMYAGAIQKPQSKRFFLFFSFPSSRLETYFTLIPRRIVRKSGPS